MTKDTEYYIKAFRSLEEEKRHTWNWSAFFFGSLWMLYRKMYICTAAWISIKILIFSTVRIVFLEKHQSIDDFAVYFFIGFYHIITSCLFAKFGNFFYLKTVAYKIGKGYHRLPRYRSTLLLGPILLLCSPLLSNVYILGAIFCFVMFDFSLLKYNSKYVTLSNEKLNEHTLTEYLAVPKINFLKYVLLIFVNITVVLLVLVLRFKLSTNCLYELDARKYCHEILPWKTSTLLNLSHNTIIPMKNLDDYKELLENEYKKIEHGISLNNMENDFIKISNENVPLSSVIESLRIVFHPGYLDSQKMKAELDKLYQKHLREFYNIVLQFKKELALGSPKAKKIKTLSESFLGVLGQVVKNRHVELVNELVKTGILKYDVQFALDNIENISNEKWEESFLYMMYLSNLRSDERIYSMGAQLRDVEAMYKLGKLYIDCFFLFSDANRGIEWLKKASEQNDKTWSGYASARIAFVYMNGEAGILQDYKEANKWFEKAVKQGYYPALYELALNYYEGVGTEKDLEKAKMLLKQATKKGDKRAKKLLNSIALRATGEKQWR